MPHHVAVPLQAIVPLLKTALLKLGLLKHTNEQLQRDARRGITIYGREPKK